MELFHKRAYTHAKRSWLRKSDLLSSALGVTLIAGLALYLFRLDYRTTLDLWRSRLTSEVRYCSWTVQNSFDQSKDDVQVLADFAPARELLLPAADQTAHTSSSATKTRDSVSGLFENYSKIYEYAAIVLLDQNGQVLIQSTGSAPWLPLIKAPKSQTILGQTIHQSLYRMSFLPLSKNELGLLFVAPILAARAPNQTNNTSLGAIAVLSLFSRDIIPLLRAGNFPTNTGEKMFLQLQPNGGHYISPPRFPLPRKLGAPPKTDTLEGAATGALEDHPVFGRFVDYRGVDVIASLQKVPGIDGVVVVKIDQSEAFADFIRTARIEIITAAAAVIAYIGLILLRRRTALADEMQKTEQSLRIAKENLEAMVAERTIQLARLNDQLQKFNVELEQRVTDRTAQLDAANKELEAFAYSVSHDLRAPLRAMNGFSKIVSQEYSSQLPVQVRQFLEKVDQSSVEMEGLINGLLSLSRLGRKPLAKQPINLTHLIRQSWDDLSGERQGRQVEISVADLPGCQGDPLLLKQMFINLLSNALKYSRTRKVAHIEVSSTTAGAYYIRDNGIGFDMQYANKLFGVFQRLHQTEDFEGTGVGLAIVQRIVHRHGGRIWAEAVANEGATFYFTLAGADTANTPDNSI